MTTAAIEKAKHNALRHTLVYDWENASNFECDWIWSNLLFTMRGQSQAVLFYDIDPELEGELDFLIGMALTRKHMSKGG